MQRSIDVLRTRADASRLDFIKCPPKPWRQGLSGDLGGDWGELNCHVNTKCRGMIGIREVKRNIISMSHRVRREITRTSPLVQETPGASPHHHFGCGCYRGAK